MEVNPKSIQKISPLPSFTKRGNFLLKKLVRENKEKPNGKQKCSS
jgi:hypothetical protein